MTTKTRTPRGETDDRREGDRIAKLLARAGIASRREVERMIADGRIAIDGVALDTPATVLTSLAGVTVDGRPVQAPEPTRLFLYHKPAGLLVTERDPKGRPTIYEHLPDDLPRVVPVGRLDLATEGLLLLTTDGGFKRQLELPSTGVERAYRARAYGQVTQPQLEDLAEGVKIEGIRYGSIDANIERRTGANVWIEMILTEGKNREVRRVLEHLELQVSRLIRTRYGPFVLGDLAPGQVGEVNEHDLATFRRALGDVRHGRAQGEGPGPVIAVAARTPARAAPAPAPTVPRASSAGRQEPTQRSFRAERPARAVPRSTPQRTGDRATTANRSADGAVDRRSDVTSARGSRGAARTERTGDRAMTANRSADGAVDRRTDVTSARGSRGAARTERPAQRTEADAPYGTAASGRGNRTTRPPRPAGSTRVRADGSAASDKRPRSARPAPTKGPSDGRGRPPRTPKGKR